MTRLHHVALGARDVEGVARFYGELFGLAELRRHRHDDGTLRSIWLDLGGSILMVERSSEERTSAPSRHVTGVGSGPFLIAFSVPPSERTRLEAAIEQRGHHIDERSEYTTYTRDPEGNRVAFSHYPERG
jgi:catechol 2,3-dioxygenase-like lactoylglutathione lyase family enzyme